MNTQLLARFRNARGFSLTEAATVLSAMTVLSGAAAPAVNDYLAEAKLIKARSDVRVIAVSFVRMMNDVGAQKRRAGGWATFDLLVGGGEAPESAGSTNGAWTTGAGGEGVGLLDDQLITNDAGYRIATSGRTFGWRGAYLDKPIGPDSWGYRYAVNVQAIVSGKGLDTVVLSPGPDGVAETPFTSEAVSPVGDDIIALISSGGY